MLFIKLAFRGDRGMTNYTDYCTAFYDSGKKEVIFYDEIKNQNISKQKVKNKKEAEMIMRIWQDNAPDGIICQILGIYTRNRKGLIYDSRAD